MASASLLRIERDIAEFFADPPPGISIAPEESDLCKVNALVVGPDDTPYTKAASSACTLPAPVEYPMSPPSVLFLTTNANRVKFNPHIFANGKVCLSFLGTWSGPAWSPALSLATVLISIQSLLNQNPYYDEPVQKDDDAASRWKTFLQHKTISVAVCGTVEECLQENCSFPSTLRDVILKKFIELYKKYEATVYANLRLSGSLMADAYSYREDTCQYEELLTRLRDLKERVAKGSEVSDVTATS